MTRTYRSWRSEIRGNEGLAKDQRLAAIVLRRDRHTCGYCGAYATTVDHIVPKAKGGTDSLDNLIACCQSCNSGKGDR